MLAGSCSPVVWWRSMAVHSRSGEIVGAEEANERVQLESSSEPAAERL